MCNGVSNRAAPTDVAGCMARLQTGMLQLDAVAWCRNASGSAASEENLAVAHGGCRRAIDEPIKLADGLDQGGGQSAIPRLKACNNVCLCSARRQERRKSAAVKRRIRQSDAGLGFDANDSGRPPVAFFERRVTRKERCGVAVLANAKQCNIKQRTGGVELFRSVERLKRCLVDLCGLL